MSFRKELVYTILIFVLWEISSFSDNAFHIYLFGLGITLVLVWCITTLFKYSIRQISKYTETMVKLQIKQRWISYIFIPSIFFSSVSLYLFFVSNDFYKQFIILIGVVCLFILFTNIKSSYLKQYSIEKNTRVIFDLINIVFLFCVVSGMQYSGLFTYQTISLIAGLAVLLLLISALSISQQYTATGFVIALVFAIIVGLVAYFARLLNFFVYPFAVVLVFYMLLSFWHIRLSGERHFSGYLPPILFALMAIVIIL